MIIIDEIHNFKKLPILIKLTPAKLARLSSDQKKHIINGIYYPSHDTYNIQVIFVNEEAVK